MVAVNINVNVTAAKGALDKLRIKIPNASRKALNKTAMFLQNAEQKKEEQQHLIYLDQVKC